MHVGKRDPVGWGYRRRRSRPHLARGATGIESSGDVPHGTEPMRRADRHRCDNAASGCTRRLSGRPVVCLQRGSPVVIHGGLQRRSPIRPHRGGRRMTSLRRPAQPVAASAGRPSPDRDSCDWARRRRRVRPRNDAERRVFRRSLHGRGLAPDPRAGGGCGSLRHDRRRRRGGGRLRSRRETDAAPSVLRRWGGRSNRDRRRRSRCRRGRRRRWGGCGDLRRRRSPDRYGDRCGSRSRNRGRGLRRSRRWRRRGSSRTRREQPERVDVSLTLRLDTHAQMHGGDVVLRFAAPSHAPDRYAFGDGIALRDPDRTEMDDRHGVAVGGQDRDASPVRRQRSGEAHGAGHRRTHGRALRTRYVDAAVLSGGIGVAAERERSEHVAVCGPRPRPGRPARHERRETRRRDCEKTMHEAPPSFSARATRKT